MSLDTGKSTSEGDFDLPFILNNGYFGNRNGNDRKQVGICPGLVGVLNSSSGFTTQNMNFVTCKCS